MVTDLPENQEQPASELSPDYRMAIAFTLLSDEKFSERDAEPIQNALVGIVSPYFEEQSNKYHYSAAVTHFFGRRKGVHEIKDEIFQRATLHFADIYMRNEVRCRKIPLSFEDLTVVSFLYAIQAAFFEQSGKELPLSAFCHFGKHPLKNFSSDILMERLIAYDLSLLKPEERGENSELLQQVLRKRYGLSYDSKIIEHFEKDNEMTKNIQLSLAKIDENDSNGLRIHWAAATPLASLTSERKITS